MNLKISMFKVLGYFIKGKFKLIKHDYKGAIIPFDGQSNSNPIVRIPTSFAELRRNT